MNEPEYTYIKGQGWAVVQHAQLTVEIEGVTMTLIDRKPVDGEYFWTGPYPITELVKVLQDYYFRDIFQRKAHKIHTPKWSPEKGYVWSNYMTVIYND